ncbi:MAG TPA: DUF1800 domain-containing protein [Blastocatellia bacterium]|nr:DUF1800 domain-containing protein [Blastocatellia bacterium]
MPNVTWTRETAAHLLRRAGFGATAAELDEYEALGLNGAVAKLVDYESTSNAELDALLAQINFDFTRFGSIQLWWILRMIYTARPLEEKMVFFWHDHFATSAAKVDNEDMKVQNDLFRTYALGNFKDMLVAVSKDPAMLDWLDNRLNRVGQPNENYAREIMELFTLGVGNYTETDIHEIARCFTGWTIRQDAYFFQAGAHDNGSKSFLGVNIGPNGGELDGITVCNTLSTSATCARFLTKKLFEFFAYPDPNDATVQKYADIYLSSNFSIREVMRALFKSDEFYSDRAMHALIKSPTEFVIGALKSLAAKVDGRKLGSDISLQGQTLLVPPDVAGWDGGLAWINTTTLLARANFVNSVVNDRTDEGRGYFVNLDTLLGTANFNDKPKKLVDHFLDILGPISLTKQQKKPLKNYLVYDDSGVKQTFKLDAETKDEKVRGLIHLIMALPEYHQN